MDDDGDYFTWTLDEAQATLTEDEAAVAALHYDINDVGEMHHNPAKNVLYVRTSLEEISKRLNKNLEQVTALLDSAKKKMYAARLKRPAPYVDKTVYTSWNALCISATLDCALWTGCWPRHGSHSAVCFTWWLILIPRRNIAKLPPSSTTMPSSRMPAWTPMRL